MKRTYKIIAVTTTQVTNIIRTEKGVMVYQHKPTLVQEEKSIALYAVSTEYIGEDDIAALNWGNRHDDKNSLIDGDWRIGETIASVHGSFIDMHNQFGNISKCNIIDYPNAVWFKVIAAHDPSIELPTLPEKYVEYWVSQYNSGNIIDEIELEVSGGSSTMNMFSVETTDVNEVVIPIADRIQISREVQRSRDEKEDREYATVAYDIAPESIPTNTIEQAAEIYVGDLYHSFEFQKKQDNIDAYCAGAFSNEAKEYHTRSLYTIEDLQEAFNAGNMASLENQRGFPKTFEEFISSYSK